MTRGRLPQHVYWRRRITLLAVVGVLVVGVVSLVAHIGGGSPQRAATVSDVTTPAPSPASRPSRSSKPRPTSSPTQSLATVPTTTSSVSVTPSSIPSSTAPAVPSGPCAASDVVVTPSVASAVPGEAVAIRLALTSATTPACTFDISPDTIQVVIQRAGVDAWNTAICRQAVPTETLTVQQATPAYVSLGWGGHITTDECSIHNPWAGVGKYTVEAAALGGTPSSSTFEMAAPVETVAPSPSTRPRPKSSSKPSAKASRKPSVTASSRPSASASADD